MLFSNIGDGRHRDGQDAMLTTHGTCTFIEDGDDDVSYTESVNAVAYGCYVDNGVYGTYLMEMDLVYRKGMSLGLGLGYDTEDAYGNLLGMRVEGTAVQYVLYLCQVPVEMVVMFFIMVMVVVMIVVVVIVVMMVIIVVMVVMIMVVMAVAMKPFHIVVMVLLFKDDIEVAGIDTGLYDTADTYAETVKWKACKSLLKLVRVDTEVKKGCYGHVTADSGITFQIKGFSHIGYCSGFEDIVKEKISQASEWCGLLHILPG